MLRIDPDGKTKLEEQDSIIPNSSLTSPKTIIEIPTKSHVDRLHENSRKTRDLSTVFNDQDNEFDNKKITNLDSVSVNRNHSSENEVSNEKYVDDSVREGFIVRFIQTLQTVSKYLLEILQII